ncbi:sulfotransferase domain-containing protein [Bradyrhizobium sp. HKCCYLS3077]|uniref:sulfotransferase domain-containing protein n=1 Tax=Bradyrhizobium sp. HKCCYLS3077 TaxID=3420761 RepID=UPI003EBF4CE3
MTMDGSALDTGVYRELARGTVPNQHVFLDSPQPGPSPYYVICNSVPKAGTYLLVELVKALGGHVDVGYHTYTSSISKLNPDGSLDQGRALPAPLWTSALRPGYFCASHTEYCPYLEQYLLGRPEHKMLFIVRDPRDIVVSWVDFVYHSAAYPKMRKLNAYRRMAGAAAYPDDASRITSTLLSWPGSGIRNFISWLDSPACLTVRFEELYAELAGGEMATSPSPVLHRICDYLGLPRKRAAELDVLGRGLTSSGRDRKVGIYTERMMPQHLDLLRSEDFQELVVEFGYEPTPPPKPVRAIGLGTARRLAGRLSRSLRRALR